MNEVNVISTDKLKKNVCFRLFGDFGIYGSIRCESESAEGANHPCSSNK